jgi:hypothetical protein
MGGKAILLVVMAFSMMFTIVNYNSSNTTTRPLKIFQNIIPKLIFIT